MVKCFRIQLLMLIYTEDQKIGSPFWQIVNLIPVLAVVRYLLSRASMGSLTKLEKLETNLCSFLNWKFNWNLKLIDKKPHIFTLIKLYADCIDKCIWVRNVKQYHQRIHFISLILDLLLLFFTIIQEKYFRNCNYIFFHIEKTATSFTMRIKWAFPWVINIVRNAMFIVEKNMGSP